MTELWEAWAAGFIDGEGALMIRYQRTNKQVLVHVRVGQAVRAPLDRLVLMFQGSVRCTQQGGKDYYEWNIFSGKAVAMLTRVRPFLMVKAAHADLIMEYWEAYPALSLEEKLVYHNNIRVLQTKGRHLAKNAIS
jgi:hypothetical protein